ncbi:flagellar hook-associated protein FlgL [Helicobacter sp. faydin-H20]|uniref:flagellar hook-associated protein FlgL n=1 Tax=Helicobacter anatolicus TaxID=2905874 RepID=UPI001E31F1B6|nr:flagellar hook-associated protein FlgL [Helicobacter anatolicus]MCE3036226.1 flagellar hook-associated protein FlgL [Helicobacter anatolicus]
MRITFGTKYNQMNYHQNVLQNKLNDANNKIASGLKIKYGYQDSSVYNQDLKLDYDSTTLAQGIDTAKIAQNKTLNTDKTLAEISNTLVQFKNKMLQAANNGHSETSRKAIALDLKAMKNHIINMANTSIGGQYIFGGSKVDRPPFDSSGKYHGNNEILSTLVSSNNLIPYNITGEQLFLGTDSDKNRIITTNIRLLNQRKLHPNIMDAIDKAKNPEESYITENDFLRDLIGDDDDNPANDGKEFFYLRGVGPNGKAFKTKFALEKGYANSNNATKVEDLLIKIGEAYGNTSQNKVVDVSLSNWGQIQIKDLNPGSSSIQFHMISSNKDVDDINELYTEGTRITTFSKSPFLAQKTLDTIEASQNIYQKWKVDLPTPFITKDNLAADKQTALKDIFDPKVSYIVLKDPASKEEKEHRIDIAGKDINDLMRLVKEFYGPNISMEITNGKVSFVDYEAKENNSPSSFSLAISSYDEKGQKVKGIAANYEVEYDGTSFENQGSKLIGNVSQTLPLLNGLASNSTKLSEVSNSDLNGQLFNLQVLDINKSPVNAQISLGEKSYLILPNKDPQAEPYKIPLYNPESNPNPSITKANNVTYRQLMDAMEIALSYSNQDSKILELASQEPVSQEGKNAYETLVQKAHGSVEVSFDEQSRINVQDKTTSRTNMQVIFSNSLSNDFSLNGIKNATGLITLNANNALTIDQPKVNFFEQVDAMINAVDKDIYRPGHTDQYNPDMRNIGIQNGIATLDHLIDHIEKMIILNGTHGKTFENIIQRNEMLKTQVDTIKGENIGIDIAETYNKFANLNNNYNAVLSSTNKINQMSLVNYL